MPATTPSPSSRKHVARTSFLLKPSQSTNVALPCAPRTPYPKPYTRFPTPRPPWSASRHHANHGPPPRPFPATPCRALLQSSLISAPAHLPFSRLQPLSNHLLLPCPTILKPYPALQRIRPSSSSSSSASILRRSMPPRSPCVRVCLCVYV
ncbi:hypothetical protein KC19_N023500 [Ceratodon purpureus]|nr:hypothetical protein KC19_N023500 [Ceratodon purpureus]